MLLDFSHGSGYSKSVLEFELRNLFLEAEVELWRLNSGRSTGPESLVSVLKPVRKPHHLSLLPCQNQRKGPDSEQPTRAKKPQQAFQPYVFFVCLIQLSG